MLHLACLDSARGREGSAHNGVGDDVLPDGGKAVGLGGVDERGTGDGEARGLGDSAALGRLDAAEGVARHVDRAGQRDL